MGSIVVTEFLSLDGVMEAPGGDDNFERGAWSFEFDRGEEGNAFKTGETVTRERWIYRRNAGALPMAVTIENGVIRRIERAE